MMKNKLRSSGTTVLSALLCVLIGLLIGFLVLVALAFIGRNNTYQTNFQKYGEGKYGKADYKYILQYLADEEGCAAAQELLDTKKPSALTEEDVRGAVLSMDGASRTAEETERYVADRMLDVIMTKFHFSFGDVLADAFQKGFLPILMGGWFNMGAEPLGPRLEIANAAPLIMTGLSVAFAFKTGLFNIGAAGQYTLGAFGALVFALLLKMPWYVCLIAATLFGAIWGAIPGVFKAYFNVNEVITSIMFNWIGLYAVNTIMYGGGNSPMYNANDSKTWRLAIQSPQSQLPDLSGLGSNYFVQPATIALFIAIFVAIILWVTLNKTTFGYELKACGYSKTASRYAGINEKRNTVLAMTIAGALAGLGGALYYLSGSVQWNPQESTALPAVGFNGISVALLASSNPIGSIFSALFISHITAGGNGMDAGIFPPEVANIISGVIIYLCAFMTLFKNQIGRLFSRKKGGEK